MRFGAARRINEATQEFALLSGRSFAGATREIREIASLARTSSSEVIVVGSALMRAIDRFGSNSIENVQKAIDEESGQIASGQLKFLGAKNRPIKAVLHPDQGGIIAREIVRRYRPAAWSVYYADE